MLNKSEDANLGPATRAGLTRILQRLTAIALA